MTDSHVKAATRLLIAPLDTPKPEEMGEMIELDVNRGQSLFDPVEPYVDVCHSRSGFTTKVVSQIWYLTAHNVPLEISLSSSKRDVILRHPHVLVAMCERMEFGVRTIIAFWFERTEFVTYKLDLDGQSGDAIWELVEGKGEPVTLSIPTPPLI